MTDEQRAAHERLLSTLPVRVVTANDELEFWAELDRQIAAHRFCPKPVDNSLLARGEYRVCVDGITTSAHEAGRLLGDLQSRERGCESLEREGRGIAGRGQSGRIEAPRSSSMPYCDGMAPQGKSANFLRDASPFAQGFTTGEMG